MLVMIIQVKVDDHITKTAATRFHQGRIGHEGEMSVFANAADAGSAGRNGFENGGVGVAAIEGEY